MIRPFSSRATVLASSLSPLRLSLIAGAVALVALAGLEVSQARQRSQVRQALVVNHPELEAAFQATDRLSRRALADSALGLMPASRRPSIDEAAASLERLEKTALASPTLSWALALFRDRWLPADHRAAAIVDPSGVFLHLHARASVPGMMTRGAVLEHLEVRNILTSYCRASGQPKIPSPMCAEALENALLGGWKAAFLAHEVSRQERPYIDRSSGTAMLGRLIVASVKVCNFAPYAIDHSVASLAQPRVSETRGWIALAPGACYESSRESVAVEPAFAVAAESQRGEASVVQFVSRHANGRESPGAHWDGRDMRACVGKTDRLSDIPPQASCPEGDRLLGFIAGAANAVNAWRFNLVHPGMQLDFGSPAGAQAREEGLLDEARQLSAGVRRQVAFDADWGHRTVPYHLGPEIDDPNGVFGVGVRLRQVADHTIFGDDNPLQEGDLLIALQGRPVFSFRDITLSVIEHASSYTGGVEVPMTAVVIRDGQRLTVPASYIFNTAYWGVDHRISASLFGIADPILFSATPEAMCSVPVALNALAKGLGWLAEKLCSSSSSASCSTSRAVEPAPFNFNQCVWKARQYRALARQTQDSAFVAASFVGLIVPSPLKLVAWSPVNRLAARAIGPGWLATGLSNAVIEVPETWIQEMRAAAPTAHLSTRVANANRAAVFASAIGLVVGGVLAR